MYGFHFHVVGVSLQSVSRPGLAPVIMAYSPANVRSFSHSEALFFFLSVLNKTEYIHKSQTPGLQHMQVTETD